MSESLQLRGTLVGHNDWVTQIAVNPKDENTIISASRDKTLIVWKLAGGEGTNYGYPQKRLYGHSHFVSDVVLSADGKYALSGSWDQTLRLWDLTASKTARCFNGHTNDVLSVALSADNRQIISGSRDQTIKLWNTIAECKFIIQEDGHKDWVSCVRFSPNHSNPKIVSCGWDRIVKVWNLANCKLVSNHHGHNGYLNTVAISPDGLFCTSGGKDAKAIVWDLNDGKNMYSFEHNDIINAMCFSPNRYWLCVAYGPSIKIWDMASKETVDELRPKVASPTSKAAQPQCLSLAWSTDGQTLFAGYSDKTIRIWQVSVSAE